MGYVAGVHILVRYYIAPWATVATMNYFGISKDYEYYVYFVFIAFFAIVFIGPVIAFFVLRWRVQSKDP